MYLAEGCFEVHGAEGLGFLVCGAEGLGCIGLWVWGLGCLGLRVLGCRVWVFGTIGLKACGRTRLWDWALQEAWGVVFSVDSFNPRP